MLDEGHIAQNWGYPTFHFPCLLYPFARLFWNLVTIVMVVITNLTVDDVLIINFLNYTTA